mmetsp:Transcript_9688/g.27939  ORF Transcript_9688/g.27939 Transcript_9688/m.27939 type:complete len:316 (+) Transcript_9688:756-1703(+)
MSSCVNDDVISVVLVVHSFPIILSDICSSSLFISVASKVTSTRSRLPLKQVIFTGTTTPLSDERDTTPFGNVFASEIFAATKTLVCEYSIPVALALVGVGVGVVVAAAAAAILASLSSSASISFNAKEPWNQMSFAKHRDEPLNALSPTPVTIFFHCKLTHILREVGAHNILDMRLYSSLLSSFPSRVSTASFVTSPLVSTSRDNLNVTSIVFPGFKSFPSPSKHALEKSFVVFKNSTASSSRGGFGFLLAAKIEVNSNVCVLEQLIAFSVQIDSSTDEGDGTTFIDNIIDRLVTYRFESFAIRYLNSLGAGGSG